MITGVAFASVYTTDFAAAFAFYHDVLGLAKRYDMGEQACFFALGDNSGLYLQGGCKPAAVNDTTQRCAFTLGVDSAGTWHAKLKKAGARMVQSMPMDMGGGDYWFQFYDPAGNLLEVLGGE